MIAFPRLEDLLSRHFCLLSLPLVLEMAAILPQDGEKGVCNLAEQFSHTFNAASQGGLYAPLPIWLLLWSHPFT